ncbi:MAG: DUF2726 domain-containing protein [Candidatus Pacebacteria bacterium]|nr:DUF2726 domain-containing protein [Candidatus Paceibacterota bacterium]
MSTFLPIIIFALFVFVALVSYAKVSVKISHVDVEKALPAQEILPYVKKKYLMTKAEWVFYQQLEVLINNNFYIVPQVVLSALVEVKKNEHLFKTYNNKINKKKVDFVIFSKPYFNPLLIIELDDVTHDRQDRIERDIFVDDVARSSNLSIVHIKNKDMFNLVSIKDKLGLK